MKRTKKQKQSKFQQPLGSIQNPSSSKIIEITYSKPSTIHNYSENDLLRLCFHLRGGLELPDGELRCVGYAKCYFLWVAPSTCVSICNNWVTFDKDFLKLIKKSSKIRVGLTDLIPFKLKCLRGYFPKDKDTYNLIQCRL